MPYTQEINRKAYAVNQTLDDFGQVKVDSAYPFNVDSKRLDLGVEVRDGDADSSLNIYAIYRSADNVDADGDIDIPSSEYNAYLVHSSNLSGDPGGGAGSAIVLHAIDQTLAGSYIQFIITTSGSANISWSLYETRDLFFGGTPPYAAEYVGPLFYNNLSDTTTTVQTIIDDARVRLQDTTDKSFTDAILMDFINDGLRDFSIQTGAILKAISVTPGQIYKPNNILLDQIAGAGTKVEPIAVHEVWYGSTRLNYAPRSQTSSWETHTVSSPSAWSQYGNMLFFDRSLDETLNLSLFFSQTHQPITTVGDTIEIPNKFIHVLTDYVLYRAYDMDREGGLAERAIMAYQRGVESVSSVLERQIVTGPWGEQREPSRRRRHKRRGDD
mgnify:CR=1 FL=1